MYNASLAGINMSEANKVNQCVEILCASGCDTVRAVICSLENNEPAQTHEQLVNELDENERTILLAELVGIMAVYEEREG